MCKSCCVVITPEEISKINEIKNQRILRGKIRAILGEKFCVKFFHSIHGIKEIPKNKKIEKIIIDTKMNRNEILFLEQNCPFVPIYYSIDDFKNRVRS